MEERDFSIHVTLPTFTKPAIANEMKMLKVPCSYSDLQETIRIPVTELTIQRLEYVSNNKRLLILRLIGKRYIMHYRKHSKG
jgi:hypothetical protein